MQYLHLHLCTSYTIFLLIIAFISSISSPDIITHLNSLFLVHLLHFSLHSLPLNAPTTSSLYCIFHAFYFLPVSKTFRPLRITLFLLHFLFKFLGTHGICDISYFFTQLDFLIALCCSCLYTSLNLGTTYFSTLCASRNSYIVPLILLFPLTHTHLFFGSPICFLVCPVFLLFPSLSNLHPVLF